MRSSHECKCPAAAFDLESLEFNISRSDVCDNVINV